MCVYSPRQWARHILQGSTKSDAAAVAAHTPCHTRAGDGAHTQYGHGLAKKSSARDQTSGTNIARTEGQQGGRYGSVNIGGENSSGASARPAPPLDTCAYPTKTHTSFAPVAAGLIYPMGIHLTRPGSVRAGRKPRVSRPRGRITRFSAGAKGRFRKFHMEYEVIGRRRWGFTLTTRRLLSAREFALCRRRMKDWCAARGIGAIIRRALQDRGAEHVHGIGYFRDAGERELFRAAWLRITCEAADKNACAYSVRFESCENARAVGECVGYSLRRGERPVESGSHWAVWGRQHFSKITPDVFNFPTARAVDAFRRGAEGLLVPKKAKKRRRRHLPRDGNWRRIADGVTLKRLAESVGGTPGRVSAEKRGGGISRHDAPVMPEVGHLTPPGRGNALVVPMVARAVSAVVPKCGGDSLPASVFRQAVALIALSGARSCLGVARTDKASHSRWSDRRGRPTVRAGRSARSSTTNATTILRLRSYGRTSCRACACHGGFPRGPPRQRQIYSAVSCQQEGNRPHQGNRIRGGPVFRGKTMENADTLPPSPHARKRSAAQRAADLMFIETHVIRGRTQGEVAELLANERPYRISRQQVAFDVAELKRRWSEAATDAFASARAKALRMLDEVERLAWEMALSPESVGDGIRRVLDVHDRRVRLLGLEAPARNELSAPPATHLSPPLSDAEQEALLERHYQRMQRAKQQRREEAEHQQQQPDTSAQCA